MITAAEARWLSHLANRNIDTIDAGVPVLSMHAPYETVAKFDCYMTYKCMKTVFEKSIRENYSGVERPDVEQVAKRHQNTCN